MTLNWNRPLWQQMSRHAFLGTPAGQRGLVIGIIVMVAGIPLGLLLRSWATGAWGLYRAPGVRTMVFLMGFLVMLVIGVGVIAGAWGSSNAHIGRIEQQAAQVERGGLVFTFKFKGRGLPDARHIIVVRLDPATTSVDYDPDLRLVTFRRVGDAEAIWHGYTRGFSTSGPTSEYDMELLTDYTIPDDFEPSLLQTVMPYFSNR